MEKAAGDGNRRAERARDNFLRRAAIDDQAADENVIAGADVPARGNIRRNAGGGRLVTNDRFNGKFGVDQTLAVAGVEAVPYLIVERGKERRFRFADRADARPTKSSAEFPAALIPTKSRSMPNAIVLPAVKVFPKFRVSTRMSADSVEVTLTPPEFCPTVNGKPRSERGSKTNAV